MNGANTYEYKIEEADWNFNENKTNNQISQFENLTIQGITTQDKKITYTFNIRGIFDETTIFPDEIPETPYLKLKEISIKYIQVSNIARSRKLTIFIPATFA